MSRHLQEIDDPSVCIRVKMEPGQVHFFTRIMEAYCHLVFISPVNSTEGVVALFATPDNMPEVREIVANLPFEVIML